MTEPGYVGMATGIIGAITGVAGMILGYVSYKHSNTLKSLDLRLELRKAVNDRHSAADIGTVVKLMRGPHWLSTPGAASTVWERPAKNERRTSRPYLRQEAEEPEVAGGIPFHDVGSPLFPR